jgi:hypothetical protein
MHAVSLLASPFRSVDRSAPTLIKTVPSRAIRSILEPVYRFALSRPMEINGLSSPRPVITKQHPTQPTNPSRISPPPSPLTLQDRQRGGARRPATTAARLACSPEQACIHARGSVELASTRSRAPRRGRHGSPSSSASSPAPQMDAGDRPLDVHLAEPWTITPSRKPSEAPGMNRF